MSQRVGRPGRGGLISRHMHPKDRRQVEVELTAAGMALVDEVTPTAEEAARKVRAGPTDPAADKFAVLGAETAIPSPEA